MMGVLFAGAVGGGMLLCCNSECCEKPDDWKIDNEIIGNEKGAGWLYKRGKGAAVWSKRYFTLTDAKMLYFLEQDRMVMKGEIVLAGAIAAVSTTRANSKKKHYLTITHPQCGSREFYAKSKNRQMQWIEKINDISASLSGSAVYGRLCKQGGLSRNVWQERWCICAGSTLDYFENASDNQSKGSIELFGASVTEVKLKDKLCFELVPSKAFTKKNDKKYVFSCEREGDRSEWVAAIKRAATRAPPAAADTTATTTQINPIAQKVSRSGGNDEDDDDGDGIVMTPKRSMSSSRPAEYSGYLMKKSPAALKGWQSRFFKISSTGEMSYYKKEQDEKDGNAPQGQIIIPTINPENGLELNKGSCELTIKTANKTIYLKAANSVQAQEWHDIIESWALYLNSGNT